MGCWSQGDKGGNLFCCLSKFQTSCLANFSSGLLESIKSQGLIVLSLPYLLLQAWGLEASSC